MARMLLMMLMVPHPNGTINEDPTMCVVFMRGLGAFPGALPDAHESLLRHR